MLTLEQQQLALQALIAQRPVETPDPWLQSVADSPGLKMIHRIGSWWQRFQLESQCRYTTRLMKRLGCFERLVDEHFLAYTTPPSIEELATQFLSEIRKVDDPLLSAVAHFELASLAMADAPVAEQVIFWDRDPNLVLAALEDFSPLPDAQPSQRYILTIGPSQRNGMSCFLEKIEKFSTDSFPE